MERLGAVRKALERGELDGELLRLRGGEAAPARQRAEQVLDGFQRTFGGRGRTRPSPCALPPARTADSAATTPTHQHGRVLAASVNVDFLACAALNGTDTIRFQSEGWPLVEVALDGKGPRPEENETTASLVRGDGESWPPGGATPSPALTPTPSPTCCPAPACPPRRPVRCCWG